MKHPIPHLLCAALWLTGCVHDEPVMIDPAAEADRLETRTLDGPEFLLHLREVLGGNGYAEPEHAWSLNELTAAALYFNPSLALAWRRADVARAEVDSVSQRPNPSVSVSPGYNTSSSGLSPWIVGLGLSLPLETGGKRKYRAEAASLKAEAERLRVAAEAWRVRQGVRAALLDLSEAQEAAGLAGAAAAEQGQVCEILSRQCAAGEASKYDVEQAQVELRRDRVAACEAEGRRGVARTRLAGALGLPAAALDGKAFGCGTAVPEGAEPDVAVARRAALTGRAELLAALKDYEACQSALRVAIAGQYPDLEIGPGYEFDQGDNKWSVGATLTLPVFHRNRGAIRKALAEREEAAAVVLALQVQVGAEVDQALAAVRAADAQARSAADFAEAGERRLRTAEKMRTAGAVTALDVQIAKAEVARARMEEGAARANRRRALGQLEDALQRPVDLPERLWSKLPGANPGERH